MTSPTRRFRGVTKVKKYLEVADWFSRVGVKDTAEALVLSSWEEAIDHCGSAGWTHVLYHVTRELRDDLGEWTDPPHLQRWRRVERVAKQLALPLVKQKTRAVMQENNLPQHFQATVYWNIFCAFIEVYYADIVRPGFCLNLAYWYARGHFPCDWQGARHTGYIGDSERTRVEPYDDFYPAGFYDGLQSWYQTGDWGDWQGQIPHGKLIVY